MDNETELPINRLSTLEYLLKQGTMTEDEELSLAEQSEKDGNKLHKARSTDITTDLDGIIGLTDGSYHKPVKQSTTTARLREKRYL